MMIEYKKHADKIILDFLKNNFLILNTTPEIAFLAGTIKAKYQTREKGLSHVDAIICASAIIFACIIAYSPNTPACLRHKGYLSLSSTDAYSDNPIPL